MKKPLKSSEKAWVDKHIFKYRSYGKSTKLTFLDFTRYYRWYTTTSRSEIINRIERRTQGDKFDPFKQGWYPRWPRFVR